MLELYGLALIGILVTGMVGQDYLDKLAKEEPYKVKEQ